MKFSEAMKAYEDEKAAYMRMFEACVKEQREEIGDRVLRWGAHFESDGTTGGGQYRTYLHANERTWSESRPEFLIRFHEIAQALLAWERNECDFPMARVTQIEPEREIVNETGERRRECVKCGSMIPYDEKCEYCAAMARGLSAMRGQV